MVVSVGRRPYTDCSPTGHRGGVDDRGFVVADRVPADRTADGVWAVGDVSTRLSWPTSASPRGSWW